MGFRGRESELLDEEDERSWRRYISTALSTRAKHFTGKVGESPRTLRIQKGKEEQVGSLTVNGALSLIMFLLLLSVLLSPFPEHEHDLRYSKTPWILLRNIQASRNLPLIPEPWRAPTLNTDDRRTPRRYACWESRLVCPFLKKKASLIYCQDTN